MQEQRFRLQVSEIPCSWCIQEAEKHGIVGVLTGMFEVTSSGISAAIVFGFIGALIFKPKG